MQLTSGARHAPLIAATWLIGCEPGGLTITEPLPPDAPPSLDASSGVEEGGLDAADGNDGGSGGDPAGGVTLIPSESTWRVGDTPSPGWTSVDFDDSAWPELAAPIGRGYDDVTPYDIGGSIYLRHTFSGALAADDRLELRVRRDDGAIAYLDGAEAARFNVEPDSAGETAMVNDEVDGAEGSAYFVASPAPPSGDGSHVLAVEVHQGSDPDLVFDARLRTLDLSEPLQTVLVAVRTRSYGGMFAPNNVGAIWIEDMAGNFVRSLLVWGKVRREHLVVWSAASGDNRVDATTAATAESHHSWLTEWDLRDADGDEVPPGVYTARFELAEENANEGFPAGPTTSLTFSTGSRGELQTGATESLVDIVVFVP